MAAGRRRHGLFGVASELPPDWSEDLMNSCSAVASRHCVPRQTTKFFRFEWFAVASDDAIRMLCDTEVMFS